MATRTPHTTTEPDGFERLLGPASRRYFANGYRRTSYEIEPHSVRAPGHGQTSATGRVQYADDWSTKSESETLTPHLSTVDAAVLSAKMMETTLAGVGLTSAQIGNAWIERLSIRAGARPLESLSSIPLKTRLLAQISEGSSVRSEFESSIGSLSVTARIWHASPAGEASPHDRAAMEGPLTSYYQSTRHQTRVGEVDTDRQTIHCHHHVRPSDGGAVGLESDFWPEVTLIDCLVLAGKMAQSLIYALEQVDRAETSNLWMRRASFEASPPAGRRTSSDATMALIARTTANRGDRALNGVTVEVPDLFGVRVSAALAY